MSGPAYPPSGGGPVKGVLLDFFASEQGGAAGLAGRGLPMQYACSSAPALCDQCVLAAVWRPLWAARGSAALLASRASRFAPRYGSAR